MRASQGAEKTFQATYQLTRYSNDYRTSDSIGTLNPNSNLVRAVGGKEGCRGMRAQGGVGASYVGAIYAAQASLVAEQATRPGSLNVIILITSGYADARKHQLQSSATDSGTYPSWLDECGQAITAARDARKAGTRIYSVAYNAPSTGCPTDVSGAFKGYSPCQTMRAIASSPAYFFSYNPSGAPSESSDKPCVSAAHPDPNLTRIFTQIARSIRSYRTVPKKRQKV